MTRALSTATALSFEEAFDRYVIYGDQETEGYFLLMAYLLSESGRITPAQSSMMDKHYETKDIKSYRRLAIKYYPTLVYFRGFDPIDVNIFNVINPMLGKFKDGKWHYRSRDAYDVLTMMFHIITDKDRKLYDFYTNEIAEGRDYDKFIVGLCRSQPWYAYNIYCYEHTLIPFEKCYSEITCQDDEPLPKRAKIVVV
jgi:hypothetical protein